MMHSKPVDGRAGRSESLSDVIAGITPAPDGRLGINPVTAATTAPDFVICRAAHAVLAAMHEIAVREAFFRLSTPEFHAMRQANARFAAALRAEDVDAAIAADDQFHRIAVTASANQALGTVLDRFTPPVRRLERLRFSSLSGRDSIAQHEQIVALCENDDLEGAAAATRANWQTLAPLLTTLGSGPDATRSGHLRWKT